MIDALLIINEAGALLFNWHPEELDEEGSDDLLSGFLTALNSFATFERGEDIKSLRLKETTFIFEKYDQLYQKLTFVVATKKTDLTELLHAFIHEIMNQFIAEYNNILDKEFDGEITIFRNFRENVDKISRNLGLDVLASNIEEIEKGTVLKAVIYIEPKGGNIFFIHAKQYLEKEKLSFLIPLILNSAQLLYQNHLNEPLHWFLINTVQSESTVVESRENILIVKQYNLSVDFENDFLSLEFFKDEGKYVKKPQKLIEKFENIKWDARIRQLFLIDLVGKVFYSQIFDEKYDCIDYIPETISFLTSAKKASIEIYHRVLFNAAIGGEKIITICVNFNNFALTLIGDIKDLNDFNMIQDVCLKIYKQLQ
jgi:hypothetical protein